MTTPLAEHEEVRSAIDLLGAWIEAQRVYRELSGLSIAIVNDQTEERSAPDPGRGVRASYSHELRGSLANV